MSQFLSTLSLRRATFREQFKYVVQCNFYPRSPCGERRTAEADITLIGKFLSTLSLRRATGRVNLFRFQAIISIHALLAESDRQIKQTCREEISISIHALLAESDGATKSDQGASNQFLSTLSLRRATYDTYAKVLRVNISIHALLAESDSIIDIINNVIDNFYPRSPCGERPSSCFGKIMSVSFLSTLSLRRATAVTTVVVGPSRDFYPRSPCGERRRKGPRRCVLPGISIHALLAESDNDSTRRTYQQGEFLSTLSLRRATWLFRLSCS